MAPGTFFLRFAEKSLSVDLSEMFCGPSWAEDKIFNSIILRIPVNMMDVLGS